VSIGDYIALHGRMINSELERMWQEVVIAWLVVLPQHLSQGTDSCSCNGPSELRACVHMHTGYEISTHRKLKCTQKIKLHNNNNNNNNNNNIKQSSI